MSARTLSPKTAPGFGSFIGNARAVDILRRAIGRDRLPHAMIFAGPPGVGKCTLALMAARRLNCLSPEGDDACGRCSPCVRIGAALLARRLECEKRGDRPCGSCPSCRIREMRHPDLHLVGPDEGKTAIGIKRVRGLIGEIAFQPIEARYRVVILDPADQMTVEAQNCLLKTLEEPPSRTVILLVTSNPYALLDTIRSRCRLLHFGEIPPERIERHLVEAEGRPAAQARLAALLGGGSLGAALEVDTRRLRGDPGAGVRLRLPPAAEGVVPRSQRRGGPGGPGQAVLSGLHRFGFGPARGCLLRGDRPGAGGTAGPARPDRPARPVGAAPDRGARHRGGAEAQAEPQEQREPPDRARGPLHRNHPALIPAGGYGFSSRSSFRRYSGTPGESGFFSISVFRASIARERCPLFS